MRKSLTLALKATTALSFVGLLALGTATLHWRAAASKSEGAVTTNPIPVATLNVELEASYAVEDQFVGRLEPARETRLSFERGGLVLSVSVDEGDAVQEGMEIATLDTALLEAERDRLRGERQQVVANLELARLTEGRQRKLRQQGHIAQQRLDEARLQTAALRGQVTAIDAAIRRLEIDIEKSTVLAPFSGTVAARFVDEGAVVGQGAALVELLETGRPQARIGIPPWAVKSLKVGDRVSVHVDQKEITGSINAIRPDLSTATRTVGVLIDLPIRPEIVFGDTVELTVARDIAEPGMWLPLTSLKESERGLWSVLTVVDVAEQPGEGGIDQVSQSQNATEVAQEVVEILHVEDEMAYVRGTLQPGQRVVLGGTNRVIPGQMVSISPPRSPVPSSPQLAADTQPVSNATRLIPVDGIGAGAVSGGESEQ